MNETNESTDESFSGQWRVWRIYEYLFLNSFLYYNLCPKKNCMQWSYNALPIPETARYYQKKPAHLLWKVSHLRWRHLKDVFSVSGIGTAFGSISPLNWLISICYSTFKKETFGNCKTEIYLQQRFKQKKFRCFCKSLL